MAGKECTSHAQPIATNLHSLTTTTLQRQERGKKSTKGKLTEKANQFGGDEHVKTPLFLSWVFSLQLNEVKEHKLIDLEEYKGSVWVRYILVSSLGTCSWGDRRFRNLLWASYFAWAADSPSAKRISDQWWETKYPKVSFLIDNSDHPLFFHSIKSYYKYWTG